MLGNSAFIAFVTVTLTLLVSSMAAFVLAHLRFAGKKWLANYLALGLTFPFATAVLPVFIRVRDMGLLDSYWGVILPQIAFNLGFAIVLLQGFLRNCPMSYLKRPSWTVAVTRACFGRLPCLCPEVLSPVGSWNEYLLPLVMINNEALSPWPLGIMQYQGQYGTDWGKVLAFVSLTLTPAVIFYLMAQKHIIAGLTSGAVKG